MLQFSNDIDNHSHSTRSRRRTGRSRRNSNNDDDSSRSSPSMPSIPGFSTYSADTNYYTVCETTVAKIFGSQKVKFHGREGELETLRGIYKEVCTREQPSSQTNSQLNGSHHTGTGSRGEGSKHSRSSSKHSRTTAEKVLGVEQAPPATPPQDDNKSTASTTSTSLASDPAKVAISALTLDVSLTKKEPRSVAFVSGTSGAGKSALVMQFLESTKSKDNDLKEPLFLSGKFDELAGADPFSAMVEAFAGLSTILLQDDSNGTNANVTAAAKTGSVPTTTTASNRNEFEKDLERIRKDVKAKLGHDDLAVLTSVVPALRKIFSGNAYLPSRIDEDQQPASVAQLEPISETKEAEGSTQNAWNRLKYVIQLFTRTIATHDRPLVMFLDDLQWADSGSLDLVQALVTDKRIRNFMFIGTYRSDEVDYTHPLSQRLARIGRMQPVENISLGNLTVPELIDFLHSHMKIDPFDCRNLANKVHATTQGNMFFIIQILVELNQQCALIYSEFSKTWEWDDVAGMLVLETGITDNLQEAVEMKIKRCPKMIKRALVTMAYARSTIDIETLYKLMEKDDKLKPLRRPLDMRQLSKALDRAVLEGYLSNNIGSKFYSFAHDKVLQASYALIPSGKTREKFRISMGRRLFELGSDVDGETWMCYAAAAHLNSSISLTDTDPLYVAKMNLVVGEMAQKASSFDQASACLMAGLEALLIIRDFDPWKDEYDLTLSLHRALADVELCRGKFESGNEIGRRLLEKARKFPETLATYEALALATGREELHAEALVMCREALIRLGEYPKHNRIGVLLKELLVIRRYMNKTSDEDMMNLPMMTDKTKVNALIFSRNLAVQAFYCDNTIEFLLGTVRALGITFQYGLSGYSAMSMVAYGLILSELNDHAGAVRMCRLGRRILTHCKCKEQESMFRFCAAHFLEGWGEPHEKTLEDYRLGHLVGMEIGDVEDAFLCSYAAVHQARSCGCPLASIQAISTPLLEQMHLYSVKAVSVQFEQVHLVTLYLTGTNKNLEKLWEEPEPKYNKKMASEKFGVLFWYISRVELGVYFGNYAYADKMADKMKKILERHAAYTPLTFRLFYSGLAASQMARKMTLAGKKGQARKYRSKAKRFAKALGHLNKSHGPNNRHREMVLLADANLPGKEQKPISYDRAINACMEVGHIHDAALCSELAGEYYLTSDTSKKGSMAGNTQNKLIRRHFTRARDLYYAWGAHAKVEDLQKRRGDYIEGRSATEKQNGRANGIVSIELDQDFSANSSENDFSSHGNESGIVAPNAKLLVHLQGIVPASSTADILSNIQEQQGGLEKPVDDDDFSLVSDIEDTFKLP